jgi:hypothetical protein
MVIKYIETILLYNGQFPTPISTYTHKWVDEVEKMDDNANKK